METVPIRVLVVDDDFAVADLHRSYVESVVGFEVVATAHSGAEALRLTKELYPDLILLDIHLPDISGLEVLRQLRAQEKGSDIDVVVITASREVGTVRSSMAGGVANYLVKPFPLRVMRERLEAFAARRTAMSRMQVRHPTMSGQGEVDRLLFGQRHVGSDDDLPKGLSRHTLDLVAGAVRAAGTDMSAREAADACGLSRVSARRYLEQLAAMGLVQVSPRYGSAGRPENGYRWMQMAH